MRKRAAIYTIPVIVAVLVTLITSWGNAAQRRGVRTAPVAEPTASDIEPEPTETDSTTEPEPTDTATEPEPTETTLSGATQPLSDLTPVTGNPDREPATVNGQSYVNNVILYLDSSMQDGNAAEYDLSRSWSSLRGTIGLRDDAPQGASARFQVFGDGNLLYEKDLAFGQSEAINVDVRDVLRLKLQVMPLAGDNPYYAVWGEALLEK
ncbi:NPCBM/NEW2 domain-containing protein [Streptosporangiaceae bacterium NEAU-GS5]|nr:NPCBM/NEW2 domain-containing protein [Streptosporangiaceae bacterium NEAU-GS5]